MHTGKQKQMNAIYQASLVNRHIGVLLVRNDVELVGL